MNKATEDALRQKVFEAITGRTFVETSFEILTARDLMGKSWSKRCLDMIAGQPVQLEYISVFRVENVPNSDEVEVVIHAAVPCRTDSEKVDVLPVSLTARTWTNMQEVTWVTFFLQHARSHLDKLSR